MNEFTIATHIGRPAGDVFAAITDVARTPAWTPGLSGARQTSQGPLRPGATPVIIEWERGDFDDELVGVSHKHASKIIEYFRHQWGPSGQRLDS